ncbi:phosphatase PAP2 family protein [Bradyrhizobium sp. LLZ17]|uniref:Phosphatase PAP2 family protein n=1 Tax=Bradyrhizobium sp. LLZ17 TaxID=3239388 RepID=A0AB39XPF9_9BRAD
MPVPDLANGVFDFVASNKASRRDRDLAPVGSGRNERALWFIIAAGTAGLLLACRLFNFKIALTSGLLTIVTNAVLLGVARLSKKQGWMKISGWLTASVLMSFVTIVLTALSYVLASTNLPLCDATLISLDRAIGVDWPSLVRSIMHQQTLMFVLNVAYASLHYQCPLLVPVLFFMGQQEKRHAVRSRLVDCAGRDGPHLTVHACFGRLSSLSTRA